MNFNFPKRRSKLPGRESDESVTLQLGQAGWIKSPLKKLKTNLQKYDVIYTKNELIDLLILKFIGYKNLPPVIVGIHTPVYYPLAKSFGAWLHNFLYTGFVYRWLLNGVKTIHVSNNNDKTVLKKISRTTPVMIYYPFSVHEVTNRAEKTSSPIQFDKKKCNLIFVGRLSLWQKGINELKRLIERLGANSKVKNKISINIFGTGDESSAAIIENVVKEYPFVHYFGHMENKYIPAILNEQNMLISTSLWETLPYNILEAQAMGLPVVAFDIPGPQDIIIDSVTGILAKDEDDYYSRLCSYIYGRVTFDKQKIISTINERFTPELIYNKLEQLFVQNTQ